MNSVSKCINSAVIADNNADADNDIVNKLPCSICLEPIRALVAIINVTSGTTIFLSIPNLWRTVQYTYSVQFGICIWGQNI